MAETIKLNQREVKNKILAALSESERRDAIVGDVDSTGGYIILTDYRVFEVYTTGGTVYAQVKGLGMSGWDDVDYESETALNYFSF